MELRHHRFNLIGFVDPRKTFHGSPGWLPQGHRPVFALIHDDVEADSDGNASPWTLTEGEHQVHDLAFSLDGQRHLVAGLMRRHDHLEIIHGRDLPAIDPDKAITGLHPGGSGRAARLD